MATKQTLKSLLGSSDEREQVELNLNPVSIQPTIRSAGNYRVAVQQTPLTNSALQLADALKQGVGLYGQAVNVAQDKAREDVASMSEEDFDKFLAEGLDKESLNIFGYTKAYNQALAKKYYAEKMPLKLQAIAAELHKDPYAYKDPAQFEGAAIAAVNEAYDEADELLGGNVFSEQANNALKSATKSDFVAKQQAIYLQKLPEITRKVQSDIAFKAFSEIDDVANVKDTIDQQILAVASAVGNKKDAAVIVTKAYLDNIEALAKQEGQEELAQALLDELDATTVAGLGSQGKRKFGKDNIELFNTAENRSRIEDLENTIENAGVSGYNAKLARARTAQADLELEAFGLIADANGDETTALARFEEIEADIRQGSVTLNGVTYNDTVELNEIRKFIAGARSNKDLFVHNAKLSFVQQNTGSKRAAPNQITKAGSIAKLNLEASKLLFASGFDSEGRQSINLTPLGQTVISEFNSELEQLELELADFLLSNTSLSQGDRITEYSKLYPTEVTAKMQEWMTNRLDDVVPPEPTVEVPTGIEAMVSDELTEIDGDPLLSPLDKQKAKDIIIQEQKDTLESINFNRNSDGSRTLFGVNEYFIDPTAPYQRALQAGQFKNIEEQIQGFDAVHNSFRYGASKRDNVIRSYVSKPLLREESFLERARKKGKLRDKFSLYGLSMQELSEDTFGSAFSRRTVSITDVYGESNPFSSVPIVYNGSIQNTAKVVQDYIKDSTTALPEIFNEVAENYGISVETMMRQMEAYLLTNNFISK